MTQLLSPEGGVQDGGGQSCREGCKEQLLLQTVELGTHPHFAAFAVLFFEVLLGVVAPLLCIPAVAATRKHQTNPATSCRQKPLTYWLFLLFALHFSWKVPGLDD